MPWPLPPYAIREDTMAERMRALMPAANRAKHVAAEACAGIRGEIAEIQALPEGVRVRALVGIVAAIASMIARERRLYRKYLVRRAGFDPLVGRSVRASTASTATAVHACLDALSMWAAHDDSWQAIQTAGSSAEDAGRPLDEQAAAAIEAGLQVYERFWVPSAIGMQAPWDERYRAGKLERTSGLVASSLSSRNRRLAEALAQDGGPRLDAMAREVPPAVLLAWDKREPAKTYGSS